MSYGILSLRVLPIRSEPSERAEMTTQVLFGERFKLLETSDSWSLIRNKADEYEGWVTTKMLTPISEEMETVLNTFQTTLLREPVTIGRGAAFGTLFLPAGSSLFVKDNRHFFHYQASMAEIVLDKQMPDSPTSLTLAERVLETAFLFLNAPYLWGGKTILGMDCSGLTQVSAAINGFQLPRDARDQAMLGEEQFLSLSLPGDLAFFVNTEGRIVHVGIVCGPNMILHASGSVRVDELDERGIYNSDLKKYTHQLHSIKRIFHS